MGNISWFEYILDEKKMYYSYCKISETDAIFMNDLGLRMILGLSDENGFSIKNKKMLESIFIESCVYFISDDFSCNYILIQKDTDNLMIIGPYLVDNYSYIDIKKLLQKKNIKQFSVSEVTQYYSSLPQIADKQMFEAVVRAYCTERFGIDAFNAKFEFISEIEPIAKKDVFVTEHESSIFEIEDRYAAETRFMYAVASGNIDEARKTFKDLTRPNVEKRTQSLIRDVKNGYIIFNTLCRTAAKRSNVHPKIIDQLSREFSIRIEAANDTKALLGIRKEMVIRYCNAVRNSIPTTNPTIKRVLVSINLNLDHNLTLADTAKEFGVSRGYLAKAFKDETGESFMEFVNRRRMEKAQALLGQTNFSIHHVAEVCGYMDSNYFSRKFKSVYHMTPSEYRRTSRGIKGQSKKIRDSESAVHDYHE